MWSSDYMWKENMAINERELYSCKKSQQIDLNKMDNTSERALSYQWLQHGKMHTVYTTTMA